MRLPRFAIVASFLSLPVGCGGSGATERHGCWRRHDDGRWDVPARVGGQLRFVRFRTLGATDAHVGRKPGAVLDGEHDLRERDRVALADARADRHGQAVPRRRDALPRHADVRQGREPHQVREGIGRRVVAGADLHALAGRRLERAGHRGPRPLRRSRADNVHGLHRAPDDTAGHGRRSRRRRTRRYRRSASIRRPTSTTTPSSGRRRRCASSSTER